MQTTDFLKNIKGLMKLYNYSLKNICQEFNLTLIEATIISFLYNNPSKDTACDIVEYRGLSKGNVSQAVESLIQKSLLQRIPDLTDRRKIHLSLLDNAYPITLQIKEMNYQFYNDIFIGFSLEEKKEFERLSQKIQKNVTISMKRREKNE